ncbi:hypothetical protein [Solemya elarraichensis gill symbiont]|uniref:hypothetical protein n=1 Tax=Solemya elarraichensis gill symbiont TaxID=1918949 RepID=UPI001FE893AA|nr:hypothetical protein [Solemya elarraichensis gill symbiont]
MVDFPYAPSDWSLDEAQRIADEQNIKLDKPHCRREKISLSITARWTDRPGL